MFSVLSQDNRNEIEKGQLLLMMGHPTGIWHFHDSHEAAKAFAGIQYWDQRQRDSRKADFGRHSFCFSWFFSFLIFFLYSS